jgi:hypothetical protein
MTKYLKRLSCAYVTNIWPSKSAVDYEPSSTVISLQRSGRLITLNLLNWLVKMTHKNKATPVQVCTGPEVFRWLRFPDFMTVST